MSFLQELKTCSYFLFLSTVWHIRKGEILFYLMCSQAPGQHVQVVWDHSFRFFNLWTAVLQWTTMDGHLNSSVSWKCLYFSNNPGRLVSVSSHESIVFVIFWLKQKLILKSEAEVSGWRDVFFWTNDLQIVGPVFFLIRTQVVESLNRDWLLKTTVLWLLILRMMLKW